MINPIKTNSTKISIPTRNQPCIRITIKKTLITRMTSITIRISRTTNNHHPTTIKGLTNNIMEINMRKAATHYTNLKVIKNHLIKTTLIKTVVVTTMSKEVNSTTTTKITIAIRIRTSNRMEDRTSQRIKGEEE